MQISRVIDEKKFMWDGREYPSRSEADKADGEYDESGFETRVLDENGKYLVFTRREVVAR